MLILKKFLITLQPHTQGFTLERGRGGPRKGKAWGRVTWNPDLTLADIRDEVKFPEGIP